MLVFAALTLRGLDLRAFTANLRAVPPAAVGLALSLSIAQALLLATRLWTVFPKGSRPRWALVARAFGSGQFVNAYTPGRAGDVVKVVAIARDWHAPESAPDEKVSSAMGVMLTDKGLDVASLALLALLCSRGLLASFVPRTAPSLGAVAVGLAVLAVIALVLSRARVVRAKVCAWIRTAVGVARSLMTPARVGSTLGLALAAWTMEALLLIVVAAPIGVHLTLAQAAMALVVLNVGIAVPVSVANVGTFEAASVAGLIPFGASTPQAIAIGGLHHVIAIAGAILFAATFWVWDRIKTLREARRSRATRRREAARVAV
jgi:uncharacterized membrane protein YbhN (UPF0104 family)